MTLIIIIFSLMAVAGFMLLRGRDASVECIKDDSTRWGQHAIWFMAGLMAIIMRRAFDFLTGITFDSGDAFNRLGYSMEWARQPFFATSDHIWLAGQFYMLGGMVKLLHDPMKAVFVYSCFSLGFVYAGLALLGTVLRVRVLVGGLAFIAFVLHPVVVPLSFSPMSDILATGLILIIGGAMGRAFQDARWQWIVMAEVAVSVAVMLRYEAWLLAGAVLLASIIWLVIHRKGTGIGVRLVVIGGAGLMLLFPVLWMWSSNAKLGSPLAFARSDVNPQLRHFFWSAELAADPARTPSLGGRLHDAATYQLLLLKMMLPVLTLCALGVHAGRRRSLLTGAIAVVWMLIVAVIGFRSGVASNAPQRVMLPALAVALLFASLGSVSMIMVGVNRLSRPRAQRLCGIMVAVVLIFGVMKAYRVVAKEFARRPHYGLQNDAILAGTRLRLEAKQSRDVFWRIPRKELIHVWMNPHRAEAGEYWAIMGLSGNPGRLSFGWDREFPVSWLTDPKLRLFLVADQQEEQFRSAGFEAGFREGNYVLWVRPEVYTVK